MQMRSVSRILLLGALFIVFGIGALAAVLWIPLEAADAVVDDATNVWYLPVILVGVSVVIFAVITASHRTRGWIALTASAALLLVGLGLTYPSTAVNCRSSSTEAAEQPGDGTSVLDDTDLSGLNVEDAQTDTTPAVTDPAC